MDLLGAYSSSDDSASDTEGQAPAPSAASAGETQAPRRLVGVAMPPPAAEDEDEDEEPPESPAIPADLTYSQDRALLLSLSSPASIPAIPPQEGTDAAVARLLAQFADLKRATPPVHFNIRLAQNRELSKPGWLRQQQAFMNVSHPHATSAHILTSDLPSKQDILRAYYNKRSSRTKIEFTS